MNHHMKFLYNEKGVDRSCYCIWVVVEMFLGQRNGKQFCVCVSQCCTPDHRHLLSHLWQNFPHLARTHCLPVVARRRGWPRLQSRVISRPRDSDACCISASARSDRGERKNRNKKHTGAVFFTRILCRHGGIVLKLRAMEQKQLNFLLFILLCFQFLRFTIF